MICLRYGNTNTYFANGLLLDTDMPGTMPGLCRELKRNGLQLSDIRYVLATHYHPDHVGLVSELVQHGAVLVLVDRQRDFVHFPDAIFSRQKHLSYQPIREENALVIRAEDSRAFLGGLGIEGELVPTESHSPDGIALVTDDGDCFVGDLEPMSFIEGYGDNAPLQRDWARLAGYHPRRIFFGHSNSVCL